MSILTQLFEHKITPEQALTQSQTYFSSLVANQSPQVQADIGIAADAGKAVLSVAAGLVGTLAGPAVGDAVTAVEALLETLTGKLLGSKVAASAPGQALNVAEQTAVQQAGAAIIAVVNGYIAQAQAGLAPTTPTAPPAH